MKSLQQFENKTFKQIFEETKFLLRKNQGEMAIALGISPQYMSDLVNGRKPKSEQKYAELMLKMCEQVKETELSNISQGIPLIPAEAMAGYLNGEIMVSPSEYDYFNLPNFQKADFMITVRGDSMTPKYTSGDIVICKNLYLNDIFFQWGKTYVVNTEQGALIKKVMPGEDNDHIKLVSENPEYPPIEIERSIIYQIALVLGTIRFE